MQVALETVDKSFGTRRLLRALSLTVPSGSSCAFTGASGVGKSTLLHCIAGMEPIDGGTIRWDGAAIGSWSRNRRLRCFQERIGALSQTPLLDPQATCRANVLLPACFRRLPQAEARADALLERLGLSQQAEVRAAVLSGGQQVRCGLARALVSRPALLLADEPSGTLDAETAHQLGELLMALQAAEGFTLILATHDPHLAARCAITHHLDRLADAPLPGLA